MQAGNPCLSSLVRSLKTTYSKTCWELGYAEQSAKSMTNEKHEQLMAALYREASPLLQEVAAKSTMPAVYRFRAATPLLLLLRDAVALSLEWDAGVRAHNAGILKAADLQDRRGSPLLPQLLQPSFPFAAGFKWQFAPNGTKAIQGRRAGSLPLEVLPEQEKSRDVLRLVHKLLQVRHGGGHAGVPSLT
jgi:hypothetical protein